METRNNPILIEVGYAFCQGDHRTWDSETVTVDLEQFRTGNIIDPDMFDPSQVTALESETLLEVARAKLTDLPEIVAGCWIISIGREDDE